MIRHLAAGGMKRAKIAAHPDVQCKPGYVATVLARAERAGIKMPKKQMRRIADPVDSDALDERTARAMGIW